MLKDFRIQRSPFIGPRLGRPRKDPKEVMEVLKLGLSYGYTLDKACRKLSLNKKTIYTMIKRDSWFAAEVERYRNPSFSEMVHFRDILSRSSTPLSYSFYTK